MTKAITGNYDGRRLLSCAPAQNEGSAMPHLAYNVDARDAIGDGNADDDMENATSLTAIEAELKPNGAGNVR
jgi:hypothetical protein